MKDKNELNGTGSVAAQVINDRVRVVWSPTGPKSNLGSQQPTNKDPPNKTTVLPNNVEGLLSMAKREYLSRVLQDYKVDIRLLQETHVTQNSAQSRSRIPGYNLITTIHHEKYGISAYGLQSIKAEEIETILEPDNNHRSAINVGNLTTVNIYQPPETHCSNPPLPQYTYPAII